MRRPLRAVIGLAGAVLAVIALGFVLFAGYVMREPIRGAGDADAIVVLTGADFRIAEGARLLESGRGRRLLISGVNPRVSNGDIARITGLPPAMLDCCVDIDTKALDTIGNATETGVWLRHHGFKSLFLVTSNYHMPRSLAEFSRVMPDVRLEPHAVVPRSFPVDAWWLHPGTARLLLSEYLKFLPAAVRLTATRALHGFQSSLLASAPSGEPSSAKLAK